MFIRHSNNLIIVMLFEIEEIKRRRKRLGITQKKLAELVGVSQPLIARIESGSVDPKLSLVKKIFDVLNELEGRKVNAMSLMNPNVICAHPNDSPAKIIEIMREKGISQLPVVDGNKIFGSITESSIIRIILTRGADSLKELKVRDLMEEPLPIVSPDETLENVSKMLLNNPALLVVEGGEIKGIITKHDVMKVLRG